METTDQATSEGQSGPSETCRLPELLSRDQGNNQMSTRLTGIAEEALVDQETIEHVANHCQTHFAAHGNKHKLEVELDSKTTVCFAKLDESNPCQFAQVFKAAKGKNPGIPSC